jgi:hypothetical protein
VRSDVLESRTVIGKFAEVVTEDLLIEITEKMKRFDADVGAFQSTLEQAPKVFESIGVNLPVNVAFGMANNLMCESLLLESHIGHERIGVDRAACCDVTVDFSMHFFFATVAYDANANFSTTFQDTHDSSLDLWSQSR